MIVVSNLKIEFFFLNFLVLNDNLHAIAIQKYLILLIAEDRLTIAMLNLKILN
jgi:hypothetical protein